MEKVNRQIYVPIVQYNQFKGTEKQQNQAKSENEVIVRCTGDTHVTPGKGKQRYRVIEIGLRPAGADSERGIYEKVQFIKDHV